jgi:ATP-binding cassette subfamily B protein
MTSSAETPGARTGEIALPGGLSAMWRSLKLAHRAEPSMLLASFALTLLAALPDALMALWLKLLADGVLGGDRALVVGSAIGLGVSATGTWFLRLISTRVQRRFRDRVTVALETHVARLQAQVATIEHHERPEYLDRLSMLRNQVFVLDHMYMSLFGTCGWILRLVVAIALLVTVHPALVLLALFALPTVLASAWRPGIERAIEERAEPHARLARHLFVTATGAPPGKEVRVMRLGPRLVEDRRAAFERWYGPIAGARRATAALNAVGWAVFGLGYVGAVLFVSSLPGVTPGQVLLVLAAGSRLSSYIGAAVGEIGWLRGFWLDGSKRLAWLEDYAASRDAHADQPVPERLRDGIALEHVSFAYPGTEKRVLDDVSLQLPRGAVVALVGENGAGKTTLVKLLCKMYEPSAGQILVDGTPLHRMPASGWRAKVAGAFQDFFRFEFVARQSVGVGDWPRMDDEPAVSGAVERAGADDVVQKLREGLQTQLGPTWPGGVEVSFGQWQKLALARGFMREQPLLLVLDEPTAALDAETEHALFERYAAAAQGGRGGNGNGAPADGHEQGNGRITLLVSHRFSTVRMADLIVVLDGSRVAEVGTHEALMAKRGQYAELYAIQAAAYK